MGRTLGLSSRRLTIILRFYSIQDTSDECRYIVPQGTDSFKLIVAQLPEEFSFYRIRMFCICLLEGGGLMERTACVDVVAGQHLLLLLVIALDRRSHSEISYNLGEFFLRILYLNVCRG